VRASAGAGCDIERPHPNPNPKQHSTCTPHPNPHPKPTQYLHSCEGVHLAQLHDRRAVLQPGSGGGEASAQA
jgi:hypothetical protein